MNCYWTTRIRRGSPYSARVQPLFEFRLFILNVDSSELVVQWKRRITSIFYMSMKTSLKILSNNMPGWWGAPSPPFLDWWGFWETPWTPAYWVGDATRVKWTCWKGGPCTASYLSPCPISSSVWASSPTHSFCKTGWVTKDAFFSAYFRFDFFLLEN